MAFIDAKELKEKETLYIVGCKSQANTETERGYIQLIMAKEPTSVNLESPSINFKLFFPKKEDSITAKLMMQNKIIATLGSIVTIEKGVAAMAIAATLKEALSTHDIKVLCTIKKNLGKTTDQEGNQIVFAELTKMEVLEFLPKKEFEELIDFDSEVPF